MDMLRNTLKVLVALLIIFTVNACKRGEQGPIGPEGAEGSQGVAGPAGKDGSVIYSGATAPAAATGKVGDYYLNTANGNFYGPKNANGWGNPFSMRGPAGARGSTGAAGTPGSKILNGTTNPAAAVGAVGDFYLNKSTYTLYGPKTAQGWGVGLELKGRDGSRAIRSYVTQPVQAFAGPVFYTIPGINDDIMNNGYVSVIFKREQLLVNPGFFRLYPLPYTFSFVRSGSSYTATIYHFLIPNGQVGITIVNTSPFEYQFEQTNDFRYSFRFIVMEGSAVQQLMAKNPHVDFKDRVQVDKLLESF